MLKHSHDSGDISTVVLNGIIVTVALSVPLLPFKDLAVINVAVQIVVSNKRVNILSKQGLLTLYKQKNRVILIHHLVIFNILRLDWK